MNNPKFHGITSLALTFIAIIIALVVMVLTSWVLGVIYLAIMIIAPQAIPRTYCAKCPCKTHCAHVFPGKAAMAFAREPGSYTLTELTILGVALALLLGLPQFWLWQYPVLLITFWVLSAIAFIQIRAFVCKTCNNIYCPLRVRSDN
jgi:hypothetical protein